MQNLKQDANELNENGRVRALIDNPLQGEMYDEDPCPPVKMPNKQLDEWIQKSMRAWLRN